MSTGSISGVVFLDRSGANAFLTGDPGVGGITVSLERNASSDPIISTTSALDGSFTFSGLADGSYYLHLPPPVGYDGQDYNNSQNVDVVNGQGATAHSMGVWKYGSVSGTIFNDVNGNGIRDTGEEGLGTVIAGVEPHNVTLPP
ncbi:MAG TPA: SdrD B-like domain-containing protein, partial [Humisphaera sp.]|nr:SdrD B-like domain-containing protein [Humisphaera sp.]